MAEKQKRSKIARRLQRSRDELIPVKIYRDVSPGEVEEAIVLDQSENWVLLSVLRDGGFFNGFSLVRFGDIEKVKFERTFLPVLCTR